MGQGFCPEDKAKALWWPEVGCLPYSHEMLCCASWGQMEVVSKETDEGRFCESCSENWAVGMRHVPHRWEWPRRDTEWGRGYIPT